MIRRLRLWRQELLFPGQHFVRSRRPYHFPTMPPPCLRAVVLIRDGRQSRAGPAMGFVPHPVHQAHICCTQGSDRNTHTITTIPSQSQEFPSLKQNTVFQPVLLQPGPSDGPSWFGLLSDDLHCSAHWSEGWGLGSCSRGGITGKWAKLVSCVEAYLFVLCVEEELVDQRCDPKPMPILTAEP